MDFIKKYAVPLTTISLIAIYLLTRLYNILGLPIFTDEAIYVRWSQIALNDASWRFISLTDGKQPMFVWIAMTIMRFIHDPLLAGRLVSVLAGFFSMIGLFLLGRELFKNRTIGFLTAFLYAIYPFALIYDRMALYDSLVGTFTIWGLYATVLLARNIRLDIALILGMIIGAGMLTKTNAFATLYLQPVALLLINLDRKHRKKILKWLLLLIPVALIAYAMYTILRLSPYFYIIDQKNAIFFYPLQEWLKHPFTFFNGNISALINWFVGYMTAPFIILILASLFISKDFLKEKLLLIIWFITPFLYLAFFGNNIYPRFILFMTLPLLPLIAYTIYQIKKIKILKNTALYTACILLLFLYPIRTGFLILTDFAAAPIPKADKNQYYASWPSGIGVAETVELLNQESKTQKIYVATQGTFGLMPYALEIYFQKNPNVEIAGFWPIEEKPPLKIIEKSQTMPTYIVFYQPCPPCAGVGKAPNSRPVKKILQLEKKEKGQFYTLYKVEP